MNACPDCDLRKKLTSARLKNSRSALHNEQQFYITSCFFRLSLCNEMNVCFEKQNILGRTVTSVSEEKKLNPRLTKPREEFINIMDNLGLAYPKKIGKFMKLFYIFS